MAKSGRLELGDNIYGHYGPIFNHCNVFCQRSNQIWWKTQNGLLRRSRSFKVIEVGTKRKPVCDFLLVINSNRQPISYRCGVIAVYCSSFRHLAFLSHPLGWFRDDVQCSSWVHWKAHSGLPNSDNWTFFARCYGWGATAKIDRKSAISLQRGHFNPKFQVEGDVPQQ